MLGVCDWKCNKLTVVYGRILRMHHPSTNKSVVMITRGFYSHSQHVFPRVALKYKLLTLIRSVKNLCWVPAILQLSSMTFGKSINLLILPFNICKIAMNVFSTLQQYCGDQCVWRVLHRTAVIRCCVKQGQACCSTAGTQRSSLGAWSEFCCFLMRREQQCGLSSSVCTKLNLCF